MLLEERERGKVDKTYLSHTITFILKITLKMTLLFAHKHLNIHTHANESRKKKKGS